MKILLSSTSRHYNFEEDKIIFGHSTGIIAQIFARILKEFGEVDFIDSATVIKGKEYDLLFSLPRNFGSLTNFNKFGKTLCYLNIAAPGYLKRVMSEEAKKFGCKLSDCFTPNKFQHADIFLMLGGEFNRKEFVKEGVPSEKIININYGMEAIPLKPRDKNKRPVFLHIATTLGLRKGFWHVVNDFKKANIDAELWCVGKIQNEKFWIDFAKEANSDPRITVFGWIDCHLPKYTELIHGADFIVFPSLGEGQPGTVMEAVSGGCIPITSEEACFPYHPIGKYIRGETRVWEKAFKLDNEKFRMIQSESQLLLKNKYSQKYLAEKTRQVVKELLG